MDVRVRHRVEFLLLRLLAAVWGVLPLPVACALASGLAWVAHFVFRFRVVAARARIRQVFGPAMPEREVRRIAWQSFRNLAFNFVEILRARRMDRAWVDRWVDTRMLQENVERCHRAGQGGIFVVPHMGNWELAGLTVGLRGHPIFSMAARQRNPLTDEYLNRMRTGGGRDVVLRDDPHAVRQVLRRLKEGMILCILVDLRSRTPGLPVRFLGHPANIVPGLAVFARLGQVPVYAGTMRRIGWRRHVLEFQPARWADPSADRDADAVRLTQDVLDYFTAAIRRNPEQYFWYNKRWVLDPL